jgi:phosphoenolpyruvate synthase/pyruvate phosphate dikinase
MFTKFFNEINKNNVSEAGGKGASLGEMTQAGIPVPNGYVITANAFEYFIDAADLRAEIEAVLDTVNHEVVHTVDDASEKIRAIIESANIPSEIEAEIKSSFTKLGAEFVAVRSSATSEDSADAAWAGQLETYLNTKEDQLLTHVKKCWSSLFTPRAIFYRFEKGLHGKPISVAVVVQRMVNSEKSGIAFSVHPVTQDPNQLIIEAGFGLGEAIVSGQVTPDSYIVAKDSLKIVDANINTQSQALVRDSSGNNVWTNLCDKGKEQVLINGQILELSKIIILIESHYGFPCDIEWAMENNTFFITQSRPITTLMSLTAGDKKTVEQKPKWHKLLAREGVDITTISQIDVVFYDLIWKATKGRGEVFFTILKDRNFTHYIGADPKEVGRYAYKKFFNSPKKIVNYYEAGKDLLEKIKKDASVWSRHLSTKPSKNNLLSAFKNFSTSFEKISYIYSIISWLGIEAWQIDFESMLNDLIARNHLERQTEIILSTVYKPWKKTALIEIQEGLTKGVSPKRLADEYQFLRSWSVVWYKPITEDWVKSIRNPNQEEKPELYATPKLLSLLKPNAEEKKFLDIAPFIVFFKDWRDDARRFHAYHWSFLFDLLGQKFHVHRDDIGYLTLDEIEKAIESDILDKKIIERRKNGCIVTLAKKGLTMRVLDESIPQKYQDIASEVEHREQEKVVRGKIAQTGLVRGIVRVIRSYHDIKRVQDGDILVANTTHPNYLPAMQKAAAFVTNEGGTISHAAIVARELKKPCIVGTKVATQILKDGDIVEVDADHGIVRVLNQQAIYDHDDYQRLFQVQSGAVPFFSADIWGQFYKKFEAIQTYSNGVWTSYIPKHVVERTLKEGLELYSHSQQFQTYKQSFEQYRVRSRQLFEDVLATEIITGELVQNFFQTATELFKYYSKVDFFYTDLAYTTSQSQPNGDLAKNLEEIEGIKNPGREYLNNIFFGDDSYLFQVIRKISRQTRITFDDLLGCSVEEIINLVKGDQIDINLAHDRLRSFVMIGTGTTTQYLVGGKAEEFISEFKQSADVLVNHHLKGTVAHGGCIKGRIRVIPSTYYYNFATLPDIIDAMQDGEVLVAETTSPELLPACHKASAIITDQGGLLSHAAIVSRELDIPCIVGTGIATQVLKDGDMVEVDANNGVVRILK